jgi:capsular polysaccharide biosynthesis protein
MRTSVIYRYPSNEKTNSRIVSKFRNIQIVCTPSGQVEFSNDSYWVHQPNAYVAPRDRFLLDKQTKSVITPTLLERPPTLARFGFGTFISMNSDGTQIVDIKTSDRVIRELCLFISFPRGFGAFLLHGMIGLARANAEISDAVPVLVPDNLTERESQFLKLVGLDQRRQIIVAADQVVTLNEALTPSKSYSHGVQLPADWGGIKFGSAIDKKSIINLSNMVRSTVPEQKINRLFITRKDASMRFLKNEDEAFERLRRWGFERFTPTQSTPLETAKTFHNAEIIVGPASSGILNLIFAPPDAKVLEIDHPVNQRLPQAFCNAIGMKFRPIGFIPQEQRNQRLIADDHSVDIDELERAISEEIKSI